MSKDQALGAVIVAVCVIVALSFAGLLFFYDPYIACWINLGAAADVRFWLIATPVTIAFVAILAIGVWIGYTMATTPPPKPIEEVTNQESSLVFIPETPKTPLATPEETNEKLLTNEKTGAFVTPPGSALSRLFEEELGFSFTKTDLNQIQNKLPKLLVEGMELAENAEIQIQGNTVTLEITGSILDEICRQTDSQPKTHKQVGCLLSSAIACALAKATGKPITI